MKTIYQQYDTIFNTDLVTIGLRFEGTKLTRLAYLLNKPCKPPVNVYAQRAQSSIEKVLATKVLATWVKIKTKNKCIENRLSVECIRISEKCT